MREAEFLIGVDIGSSSCKTSLVDLEGKVLGSSLRTYPTYYPRSGWAEQDPELWYRAFLDSLGEALERSNVNPRNAQAICFDGITHNAVLLDGHGLPLRRSIHFTDNRSQSQVKRLEKEHGQMIWERTFHQVRPLWTLPQLLWVKENEPDIWNRTEKILFPKDYLRFRLQGSYLTDFVEAAGTLMFDPGRGAWCPEICSLIDFPPEKLPPACSPFDVVGKVGKRGEEIGISPQTHVVVGSTDTAVEVFGAGAINPGQCTIKLASVGRICVVTEQPFPHPKLLNYPHLLFPNRWYPGTGSRSGLAYRWFHDTFLKDKKSGQAEEVGQWFHYVDARGPTVRAGCDGLLFHPYLFGETAPYYNPDLRADFLGITINHGESHFVRAVLEGTAFALRDCMDLIRQAGPQAQEGRIIGGGAKSLLWRQIISDCLGIELLKPRDEDASFGAALLGGIGAGLFRSAQEAIERCVKIEQRIIPGKEARTVYDELFPVYKKSQKLLEEINLSLSNWTGRMEGVET